MHEILQQLMTVAYGIWRRRWYAVAVAVVICMIGWIFVAGMPYRYEAKTRVFVDTETVLPRIEKTLGTRGNVLRHVDIVRRTLISRPNLETIIRRSDLDRLAEDEEEFNELIEYIRENITVMSEQGGLFELEFTIDDDRLSEADRAKMAETIVFNLIQVFREQNIDSSQTKLMDGIRLVEEQITKYERLLEEDERLLAEYKQRNLEILSGDRSFVQRMEGLRTALALSRAQISEWETARLDIERQLAQVPQYNQTAGFSMGSGNGGSATLTRISALQQRIDMEKASGKTDRHPDVRAIQLQIDILLKQQEEEQERLAEALENGDKTAVQSSGMGLQPSRIYEQLALRRSEIQTNLATVRQKATDQEAALQAMEANAKRVPVVEAELKKLQRGYSANKEQYDLFVREREKSAVQLDIARNTPSVQFRVIEPPRTPDLPSGPPRLLYIATVLFAGLAAGLGVAFILSQVQSVVISVEQLRSHFDYPVLGSVSLMMSEQDRRQRSVELTCFAMSVAGLFIACGVLLAFEALTAL